MLRLLYFPYFAREGGVRNVEGVGGGESQHSSQARAEQRSFGEESTGGGVGVAVAAVQGRSREQRAVPDSTALSSPPL
ncbi:hypothetical protein CesoFtcFv8_005270 [Champsocephalus esox]|uniref:Uncharacterized protein n=1 Tax=Champsocephalus esox TaxID=159716 RepID=A0AAN8H9V1_9TELE|nr:hypothetical protein CesoFtcFv8_005270 [Champsocephalus esox]